MASTIVSRSGLLCGRVDAVLPARDILCALPTRTLLKHELLVRLQKIRFCVQCPTEKRHETNDMPTEPERCKQFDPLQ